MPAVAEESWEGQYVAQQSDKKIMVTDTLKVEMELERQCLQKMIDSQ